MVVGTCSGDDACFVTETRRWVEHFRPHLFHATRYSLAPRDGDTAPWPRLGSPKLAELYSALAASPGVLGVDVRRHGAPLGYKQISLYYLSVFVDEPPAWLPTGERTPQTGISWISFESEAERDAAAVLLAGRLAVWWWAVNGDDFHVTSGLLKSFPVSLGAVATAVPRLALLGAELRLEQPKHPIVTLYARKEMGNYDMLRCRHITDRADRLALETLGLAEYWPEILAADARLLRMTGERPGTERVWPFPGTPGA